MNNLKSINELKPCPFCGAIPYVICNKYRHDEFLYSIKCSNNDCSILPMTYEMSDLTDVIREWNRRVDNG